MHFFAMQSRSTMRLNSRISVLLVAIIFIRALTPQGFMPNDLGSGVPFVLCHGDAKSVRLLEVLSAVAENSGHHQHSHHAHHGHQHHSDVKHASSVSLGACEFGAATLGNWLPVASFSFVFLYWAFVVLFSVRPSAQKRWAYAFFQPRSPPCLPA